MTCFEDVAEPLENTLVDFSPHDAANIFFKVAVGAHGVTKFLVGMSSGALKASESTGLF